MAKDATNSVTWSALVEIALCSDLNPAAREFAVREIRRLADYLDDVIFYDRAGELNVKPLNVGKPSHTGDVQWR